MAAMQLGKHVTFKNHLPRYLRSKMLTQAALKYKVVTQMGNQGSSGDGVGNCWMVYADIIGCHDVYVWTDRPVWPQGIAWPTATACRTPELD